MTLIRPRARFLMCRPVHFAVSYAINPWMDPQSWASEDAGARRGIPAGVDRAQPAAERSGRSDRAGPPAPEVPDLVFTANAAVVMDRQVLLARFRHPERQREEVHFEAAFRLLQARGLVDAVRTLPDDVLLEGAGDCVLDRTGACSGWDMGRGPGRRAKHTVEDMFGQESTSLELADQRFYHMDTALCPLPGGEIMYCPAGLHAGGTGHDPPSHRRRPAHRDRDGGRQPSCG